MAPHGRRGVADLSLAAIAAFSFGCTIVFNRAVARDGLAPSVALGVRFGIAGIALLAVLARQRRPLLPPHGERATAISLGVVLYAAEATAFYMALERGTAAAVALIFYAYPAVVAGLEVLFTPNRMTVRLAIALVLAIVGAAIVALGGGDVSITTTGVLFVCCSIALFATYVLLGDRRLRATDSLTAATWTALGASVGVLVIGLVRGELEEPGAGALAALVGNGIATAVAFTLFFVVLGRIGPTRTAIVMALEAVSGVVLAAIFLDESIRAVVGAGGVLVLGGAVLAAFTVPDEVEAAVGEPP